MLNRLLARQFACPYGLAGRWLLGPLLDAIDAPMMDGALAALEVRPGDRVLDLGFGGGRLARALLAAGAKVIGVDRSAEMVARARARHAAALRAGQAIFLEGEAARLPLAGAAVDKAACANVLYFVPALPPVVAELRRVLVPGGRLVLAFQTAAQVRAWPGHVHGFAAHEVASVGKALVAGGFAVAEQRLCRSRLVGDWCRLVALRASA